MRSTPATNPARSAAAFRECLGTFPTGVTVVAVKHGGNAAGMTLNSFISVSLTPARVLVSLAHGTRTLALAAASRTFTINVLCDSQRDIGLAFATNGRAFPDEYAGLENDAWLTVHGALAVFRCRVESIVTVGDHDLVIGAVEGFRRRSHGNPLLFCRGAFTDLA